MRVRLVWSGPGRGHESRVTAVGQALVARGHTIVEAPYAPGSYDWEVVDCNDTAHRARDRSLWWGCRVRSVIITDAATQSGTFPLGLSEQADIHVIPSSTREQLEQRGLWCAAHTLIGPEYMPLRNVFAKWRALPTRVGIVDIRDQTGLDPYEMSVLLWSALVVITPGGVRAMECAAMGARSVYVVESEDQRDQVEMLVSAGAGIEALEGYATQAAESLTRPWAESMGEAGPRLVDGRGAYRIVEAMERING